MADGSSAVAANAPPMAVAFAPCSKMEKPEPNAALLTARIAEITRNLLSRKVDLQVCELLKCRIWNGAHDNSVNDGGQRRNDESHPTHSLRFFGNGPEFIPSEGGWPAGSQGSKQRVPG